MSSESEDSYDPEEYYTIADQYSDLVNTVRAMKSTDVDHGRRAATEMSETTVKGPVTIYHFFAREDDGGIVV